MKKPNKNNLYYLLYKSLPLFLLFITLLPQISSADITTLTNPSIETDIDTKLQLLNEKIATNSTEASLFVSRGDIYFRTRDFQNAIADYTTAITLDPANYDAYFGRGLAYGREGQIEEGIIDLSVYIKHNPNNSVAYTKRGVRYLWLGKQVYAQSDFTKALQLNPDNAEAHDDLGVILAQQKKYFLAISHFKKTVELDPTYQKGFHNLAMAYYLSGKDNLALKNVNVSLKLSPNARSSMLLKSEILKALGKFNEAEELKNDAQFLPEANWHEEAPIE